MVKLLAFFILFCSLRATFAALGSPQTHRHARSSDQCTRFADGPFGFCSGAGYNDSFKFPEGLSKRKLQGAAIGFKGIFQRMKNCSAIPLAVAMGCSYFIPHCSKGKRVYPCRRVCNEFLKQCEKGIPEFFLDYLIAACHVLPNEKASSGKCDEPPKFVTNESVPGPLDRGCQDLIIPACKNLGVSNYTLISLEQQKRLYKYTYKKEYQEGDLETDFPPVIQVLLQKYPKCQDKLKMLYCGEFLPPCFQHESAEGPGFYTICQSVCDEITRDCPDFFRNDFPEAEYCSFAGKETTSHGYCRRKQWPPPFAWARYVLGSPTTEPPSVTKGPQTKGAKVWVIAVAVVVSLVIVALILGVAIWWKWRRVTPSQSGYAKQEDDTAPLEGAMEL